MCRCPEETSTPLLIGNTRSQEHTLNPSADQFWHSRYDHKGNNWITNISIYYQNVRGLRTKLHHLRQSIPLSNYDIIAFSETWLHDGISDAELGFICYDIYRFDRNASSSVSVRGGGVLVAVKQNLKCSIINSNITSVEHILIKLTLRSNVLIIGLFYIPPRSDHNFYRSVCSILENVSVVHPTATLCILGDFNLPFVTWSDNVDDVQLCVPRQGSTRQQAQIMCSISETMQFFNLTQIILNINFIGSILDLIFLNTVNYILEISHDPILSVDNYHPPLLLNISFINNCNLFNVFTDCFFKYAFINANVAGVYNFILNVDWRLLLDTPDINNAVDVFYTHIYTDFDFFVQ